MKSLKNKDNLNTKTVPVVRSLKFSKRVVFLVVVIFVAIIAVSVLGVHYSGTKAGLANNVPSTSLSVEPGTYLTIQTEPGGIAGITGTEQCLDTAESQDGISCQLDDKNATITLTAPESTQKDGKKYVFLGWDGCSESLGKTMCKVVLAQGANVKIRAMFTSEDQVDTSATQSTDPDEPYLEFKINGESGNGPLGHLTLNTPSGQKSVTTTMELTARNLVISDCKIVDNIIVDDTAFSKQTLAFKPLPSQQVSLVDGKHSFSVTCPAPGKTLSSGLEVIVRDYQPKLCSGFQFNETAVTATNFDNLKNGIVGHWEGCVTTPWIPAYYVSITFRSDGTYTAYGNEILDGMLGLPMYYGGQQAGSKDNKYAINDLRADMTGTGTFNIVFTDGSGSVVGEDMRDVRLMGDKLSFNFKHFNMYGPLTYRLYRK